MRYEWPATLVIALVVVGCHPGQVSIEERQISQRNPTEYDFNASMEEVKRAVDKARGQDWRDSQGLNQGAYLSWKGEGSPFARKIFANSTNENDAFLAGMGESVGKSPVYLKGGKELDYYADFQIHLTEAAPSKTHVEIFTQDGRVLAGTEWLPFARAGVWARVDPTSIEEYQILLDIGKQLGITNIPALKVPTEKSQSRRVSRPRWN